MVFNFRKIGKYLAPFAIASALSFSPAKGLEAQVKTNQDSTITINNRAPYKLEGITVKEKEKRNLELISEETAKVMSHGNNYAALIIKNPKLSSALPGVTKVPSENITYGATSTCIEGEITSHPLLLKEDMVFGMVNTISSKNSKIDLGESTATCPSLDATLRLNLENVDEELSATINPLQVSIGAGYAGDGVRISASAERFHVPEYLPEEIGILGEGSKFQGFGSFDLGKNTTLFGGGFGTIWRTDLGGEFGVEEHKEGLGQNALMLGIRSQTRDALVELSAIRQVGELSTRITEYGETRFLRQNLSHHGFTAAARDNNNNRIGTTVYHLRKEGVNGLTHTLDGVQFFGELLAHTKTGADFRGNAKLDITNGEFYGSVFGEVIQDMGNLELVLRAAHLVDPIGVYKIEDNIVGEKFGEDSLSTGITPNRITYSEISLRYVNDFLNVGISVQPKHLNLLWFSEDTEIEGAVYRATAEATNGTLFLGTSFAYRGDLKGTIRGVERPIPGIYEREWNLNAGAHGSFFSLMGTLGIRGPNSYYPLSREEVISIDEDQFFAGIVTSLGIDITSRLRLEAAASVANLLPLISGVENVIGAYRGSVEQQPNQLYGSSQKDSQLGVISIKSPTVPQISVGMKIPLR